VATPLRALKKATFDQIAAGCADLRVLGAAPRASRSADALSLRFDLPEGASGVVHVATIKAGLPPGAFELDPSLMVYGGRLRALLDRLPDPNPHYRRLGTSLVLKATPGEQRLVVRGPSSPAVARVIGLVRGPWGAVLAAFTRDFGDALDFTVAHPEYVSDPFAAAVLCALWSRRAKSIPKLVALTRTNRWFGGSLQGQEAKTLLAGVRALVAEGSP
jgi:hypothetical protein